MTANPDAVLNAMRDEIDRTISGLTLRSFEPDPIAGPMFSKITSLFSSAYKRHGMIIERAIFESLRQCDRFVVWSEEQFCITNTVDHIVTTATPSKLIGTDYPYEDADANRSLQVDLLAYQKSAKKLNSYEIKRGGGLHDAGKQRSMLRDTLCTQILLKSYGQQRGFEIHAAFSHVVFYYGRCSIPKPFAISGDELDEHFGWPIRAAVEKVNEFYQARLFGVLAEL